MKNRLLIATTLTLAGGTAFADEPALTPEPGAPACEPATCPAQTTQAEPVPVQPAPQPMPQPQPQPMTYPESTDTVVVTEPEHPWYIPRGFGLAIGGGVDDFVGDTASGTTGTGGSWTVRGTIGTRSMLALEGSYIGSAQSIDRLGLDNDAVLVGNGAQADVRLNLLEEEVQPFIYAGGAWRHYSISNETFNTSDVNDNADVFELPVGVGVAGYIPGGFMADVRAEYRAAWGDDLFPDTSDNDSDNTIGGSLDRFGVTGNIGAEF
jgi:hypothetical protein